VRQIAALIFAVGITGLFLLERDPKRKTSKALLLPLTWLLIAGSRNVGEWLQWGSPSDGGDAYLDGNPLDRNLLSLLIAMAVVVLIQRRKRVGSLLRANAPILLYFAYCVVSLLWSDYPFVGFKRWIRALGDVAMVLIVLTDRDWLLARKRLYAWAAFLLLPISVLLIRYYSELGRTYSIFDGQVFWTGVTTNKNELGMICMIFGLASLSRVLDVYRGREGARKTRVLLAHGVIVLTAIWLIHMADSATSLACLLIGGCLLLLTSWLPLMRRPALVHMLVAALLGVAVSALFLGVGTGMVQNLGRNSTLTGRTDMWRHALKLVENPMFGTGYESFWVGTRLEKMRPVAPGVNQAHNGYLEVYLNLGWVGVALLGIVIATGYRNVMAAFRRDPDAARLRLAYFVVALSYSFTEGAFKFRHPVWLSFLVSIMAVPMLRSRWVQKSQDITASDHNQIDMEPATVPVHEERI
jgi:exopolysaccharide production protein ExoQ